MDLRLYGGLQVKGHWGLHHRGAYIYATISHGNHRQSAKKRLGSKVRKVPTSREHHIRQSASRQRQGRYDTRAQRVDYRANTNSGRLCTPLLHNLYVFGGDVKRPVYEGGPRFVKGARFIRGLDYFYRCERVKVATRCGASLYRILLSSYRGVSRLVGLRYAGLF